MTLDAEAPVMAEHETSGSSPTIGNTTTTIPLSACRLCGSDTTLQFTKHNIAIVDCVRCGHRFADLPISPEHVSTHYGDDYFLGGGGAGYADYTQDASIFCARGRAYARRIRPYVTPGTLLDVGAAAGFSMQGFALEGWQTRGIEPNRRMARFAREQVGMQVTQGTIETFQEDHTFDLVTLLQVLAHFSDVNQAVARVAKLCRNGGHCLIETWDRGSWIARAMGRHWHEYSPPTVLHFFTARGVDQLMAAHGFRRIARGRPGKWISGSHAKSLIKHNSTTSLLGRLLVAPTTLIPNRLPIPYPSIDLFWALYQKRT